MSLLFFVFFLGSSLYYLPKLGFENPAWLPKSNLHRQLSESVTSEFNPGEQLLIGIELADSDLFNWQTIKQLRQLSAEIKNLPYFVDLKSPLDSTIILNHEDQIFVESFDEALREGHLSSLLAYKKVLQESYYYGALVSKSFKDVAFLITFDFKTDDPSNGIKRELITVEVQSVLDQLQDFKAYHLAGNFQLNYEIDQSTRQNFMRLLPLALLVMLFLLLFLFQSLPLIV
eukprot:COSAG01_NODE_1222_length_11150_cov_2.405755_6_plen_229_part_01